jgi:hypothetical protein
LFRLAIRTLLKYGKDSRVTARLTREMMKVIKADATSNRGLRNVMDGETEFLQGFEFNKDSTLSTTFPVELTTAIDRVTGQLTVAIPSFIPREDIIAPEGATHFKLVSAGSEIDFENTIYNTTESSSAVLPWDVTPTAVINLANTVTPNSTWPLFLVVGIQFYQQVNGTNYPLKNGAFNPLSLVRVSGV